MGAREWNRAVKKLEEASVIEVKEDISAEDVAKNLRELTRKKNKSGRIARKLLLTNGTINNRGDIFLIGTLPLEGDENQVEGIYFSPKGWRKTLPTTVDEIRGETYEYDYKSDQKVPTMEAVTASLRAMHGHRKLYEVIPAFSDGLNLIASKMKNKARKIEFGLEHSKEH